MLLLTIDHHRPPRSPSFDHCFAVGRTSTLVVSKADHPANRGIRRSVAMSGCAGICEKPRIKCAACQHQQFLPITDEVIRRHLSGRDDRGADFVAGVYPMLLNETCFFLAVDFDKSGWQEDALAVLATCARIGLPAVLERSRSGNGGHVWMFFEEPIPAALARGLGPTS